MFSDFRQAFRTLTTAKGFSLLIVVVLAVGIGASSAIFSVVNGVLLKPLPFPDGARLVSLVDVLRGDEQPDCAFPDFVDWRTQARTLDRMAAYLNTAVTMTGQGEAISLQVANVTSDLFPLLGARPLIGRALNADDDRPGAAAVAVLAESAWEHHFARRSSIVGETATFDGKPFTIVGVMPNAFQFPILAERIELWMPMGALSLTAQWMEQRGAHFIHVVAHLAPGATIEGANAELQTISAGLAAAYPKSNTNRTVKADPLQDRMVREYRLGLMVLLGAVGAVLLIACANVANLLLARGTARQKEMAIRVALGAPRARLIRQLLIESVTLAVLGGALGALGSLWAVSALVSASPLEIPRLGNVTVDRGVLAFTTLISVVTGILFGLAPALFLSRTDANEALRGSGRGSSGAKTARMRQTLVVAEFALSLVLLASAGLLARSLIALKQVDPGFVAEHAIAAELSLPTTRYPNTAAQLTFYQRVREELRTLPGATAGGISTTLPMSGSDLGIGFSIDGRPQAPGTRTSAGYFAVSPEYFTAMGIRLIAGRTFTDRDTPDGPMVLVISETFARRYWPDEDALGKRVIIGLNNTGPREIVGVVADVKQGELDERARPEMYTPFTQTPWPFLAVVVRTTGDPAAAAGSLRAALGRLDPNQAVGKTKMVTEYVADAVATPRFTAQLVGTFALAAVLLAGFGLFSLMAYSVAQRGREIGIRMALGAQAADVRAMVLSQALRLGGIGLAVGLAAAFAVARVLDSLLFGVGPSDPATFAGVSATLIAVLLVAAYVPARRATRVDPMTALRTE